MVALEEEHSAAARGQGLEPLQYVVVARLNPSGIFHPEIEDVAQQKEPRGVLRQVVQKVAEIALPLLGGAVGKPQMDIRNEIISALIVRHLE